MFGGVFKKTAREVGWECLLESVNEKKRLFLSSRFFPISFADNAG